MKSEIFISVRQREKKNHENSNNVQSSVRNRLLVHQEINLPCLNQSAVRATSCKTFYTRNCQIITSIRNSLCDRLLHCSHFSLLGLMVSLNKSVSIDYQKITAPHVKAFLLQRITTAHSTTKLPCEKFTKLPNWSKIYWYTTKNNKISSYTFHRQNKK